MSDTATTAPGTRATSGNPPSALRVGLQRGYIEIRQFLRERDAVVFTLGFPVGLMILFASIFHGEIGHTGVDYRQVFISGMIASGIMSTSFSSLAISIAQERDDGTLKRLAGTPMPRASYFIGKVILVLATGVLETALLLAIGTAFFGLDLPQTGARWLTLAWVFVLSLVACSLMGIAMSSVPRSGRAAAAVVQPPFIILQFISGVYFLFSALPSGLQQVAAIFPLKWMTQGLRSVFLPDSFLGQEPAHAWEHGRMALVLLAWCVGGLVLCLRTFRWKGRRDG
ncbi:MAG: ABC transporter [Pseudonocardiales bacterium]|nr:MAG: ABC transporter [Pseudonocardiales bacterium]